jgi:hypothetical protein
MSQTSDQTESQTLEAEAEAKKPITIYVNTRQKEVTERGLTFDQVVALAQPLPSGPNWEYTIDYRHAAGDKHKGELSQGETVKIKNGTIFDVTATDKS